MDRPARPSRNRIFPAAGSPTSAKSMGYLSRRRGNCRRLRQISLFVNADLRGDSKVWCVVRGPSVAEEDARGLTTRPNRYKSY
jgi:hypothetical protein